MGADFRITAFLALFLTLLGLAVLPGCIQTEAVVLGSSGPYPSSPEVEIFYQRPARPYQEIAVVQAKGSVSQDDLLRSVRSKAQSLGADAVIVLPEQQEEGTGGLLFPVIKAIAIKFY